MIVSVDKKEGFSCKELTLNVGYEINFSIKDDDGKLLITCLDDNIRVRPINEDAIVIEDDYHEM